MIVPTQKCRSPVVSRPGKEGKRRNWLPTREVPSLAETETLDVVDPRWWKPEGTNREGLGMVAEEARKEFARLLVVGVAVVGKKRTPKNLDHLSLKCYVWGKNCMPKTGCKMIPRRSAGAGVSGLPWSRVITIAEIVMDNWFREEKKDCCKDFPREAFLPKKIAQIRSLASSR